MVDHFRFCVAQTAVPDPLLFFLYDTNGQMMPGLVVVDRRVSSICAVNYDSGDSRERNLHIARSAIIASQSPKKVAQVIAGLHVANRQGVELTFVFHDRTQFSIYESVGDTLESLTLLAYKRLLKSPTRSVA